jgi:hypothetical protein
MPAQPRQIEVALRRAQPFFRRTCLGSIGRHEVPSHAVMPRDRSAQDDRRPLSVAARKSRGYPMGIEIPRSARRRRTLSALWLSTSSLVTTNKSTSLSRSIPPCSAEPKRITRLGCRTSTMRCTAWRIFSGVTAQGVYVIYHTPSTIPSLFQRSEREFPTVWSLADEAAGMREQTTR